jgi:hypothetical protein
LGENRNRKKRKGIKKCERKDERRNRKINGKWVIKANYICLKKQSNKGELRMNIYVPYFIVGGISFLDQHIDPSIFTLVDPVV